MRLARACIMHTICRSEPSRIFWSSCPTCFKFMVPVVAFGHSPQAHEHKKMETPVVSESYIFYLLPIQFIDQEGRLAKHIKTPNTVILYGHFGSIHCLVKFFLNVSLRNFITKTLKVYQ
uniref:Uncharacterized protein n=1 Tax=Pyxicephalus adspersus TaxID=30357 RepID=A0AAV3ASU2_PYXAD|nr:TPA: hypothetical protein GDO54_006261 [Pyxicephalus adspersus]